MKWKNTWILVGAAALLFAFIFLFERRLEPSGVVKPAAPLFTGFRPTTATGLSLRHGKEVLSLQLTNEAWQYRKPFTYPAANFAVKSFLETLEHVVPATHITPGEMLSRKQTAANFGFDAPPIALGLERGDERVDLKFGARTPAGDQVYVQIGSDPSVFVVSSELLDRVPRTPNDWRHAALFDFGSETPDRVEVGQNGSRYELRLDATNKLWRLTRPPHRADQNQAHEFLKRIQQGRVVEFVTDDLRADSEAFGLQTPEFEVTLAAGAVARRIQFGKSPTNNPGLVYARMLMHSNVVLVPKSAVEPLALPYTELRERALFPFAPEFVDLVEVRGDESFVLRRAEGGVWKAGEQIADPAFVAEWLRMLSQLEANEFVQDVVSDFAFAKYGLEPGQRQYTLRTTVTNGATVTNLLVARLAFGTNGTDGKAYARRFDEDSVYGIRPFDFLHLPVAAWQFREHRIWNFTTNQVTRINVRQGGTVREVIRQPDGQWIGVRGWAREINPFAMEEIARALGELSATMWLGKGEGVRARFGFGVNPVEFEIELRGEPVQKLVVEFGGLSPMRLPYALTMVEGQPVVFEFPWVLYADLQRYFELAAPRTAP